MWDVFVCAVTLHNTYYQTKAPKPFTPQQRATTRGWPLVAHRPCRCFAGVTPLGDGSSGLRRGAGISVVLGGVLALTAREWDFGLSGEEDLGGTGERNIGNLVGVLIEVYEKRHLTPWEHAHRSSELPYVASDNCGGY